MPKKKESRELEWYQGEIRKLESANKALRKRLKVLERNAHVVKELKLDEEAQQEVDRDKFFNIDEPRLEICPNCARRGLTDLVIYNKLFKTCTHCKYRSKATTIDVKND